MNKIMLGVQVVKGIVKLVKCVKEKREERKVEGSVSMKERRKEKYGY